MTNSETKTASKHPPAGSSKFTNPLSVAKFQNAQCAGDAQPFFPGYGHALAVVHQQRIGIERCRQGNGGFFPAMNSLHQRITIEVTGRFAHLDPSGRLGNPAPHRQRRVYRGQFRLHDGRQDHSVEQGRKKIDMVDQYQVMDGSGIGDDQPHGSEPGASQIGHVALEVFHGEVLVDSVRLEKAVEFISGLEPEQEEEFGVGDMPVLVFFESQAFESAARQITTRRAEASGNGIGDVNCNVHQVLLSCSSFQPTG